MEKRKASRSEAATWAVRDPSRLLALQSTEGAVKKSKCLFVWGMFILRVLVKSDLD